MGVRRRLGAGLGAVLWVGLAGLVVAGPGAPAAEAAAVNVDQGLAGFKAPPAPVTLSKGAALTMPTRMLSMTNPVGLTINTVAAGYALYSTRDIWMPAVSAVFNGDWDYFTGGGAGTGIVGKTECRGGATSVEDRGSVLRVHGNIVCDPGWQDRYPAWSGPGLWRTETAEESSGLASYLTCADPVTGSQFRVDWHEAVSASVWMPGGVGYSDEPNPCYAKDSTYRGATVYPKVVGVHVPKYSIVATSVSGSPATDYYTLDAGPKGSRWDISVTTQCMKISGATTWTYQTLPIEQYSGSQVGTGEAGGIAHQNCSTLGPGWGPYRVTTKVGTPPGVRTAETADDDVVSDLYVDRTLARKYELCWTPGACRMEVLIDGLPCEIGMDGCTDWLEQSRKAEPKYEYSCRWGTYILPLTDCYQLKYAYRTDIETRTAPDTKIPPATDPVPLPQPDPRPNTEPPATEPPATQPPATTPCQDGSSGAECQPTNNVGDERSCMADAWSWNPIDWVYVPVKCVIRWAFIPDPSSWDLAGLVEQFRTRPPGSLILAIGESAFGLVDAYAAAASCSSLPDFGPSLVLPCDGLKGVPGGAALYAIASVAIIAGAAWDVLRFLGKTIEL